MNGFELGTAKQERRPEPKSDADHAVLGTQDKKSPRPSFPRLMQALEDVRLAEHDNEKAARRGIPKFQRLHNAIVTEQLGSRLSPQPADVGEGDGDDGGRSQYYLQLLPACSVAAMAGIAVALVGGSFMAQLAATSATENDQPPAMQEVMLASLDETVAPQHQMVSKVGNGVLRGATDESGDRYRDEPAEHWPSPRGPALERGTAQLTLPSIPDVLDFGEFEDLFSVAIGASDIATKSDLGSTEAAAAEEEVGNLTTEHSSYISAYDHGYMLQQRGRYEEALENYRSAIMVEPGSAHIVYNMGAVLSELGRLEEAAAAFARAAALDETNAFAFYDWGWVLERTGAVEEAIEKYQLAIATDAVSNAGINAQKRLAFLQK